MVDDLKPMSDLVGMVDSLASIEGGPGEDGLAFARAYMADGEMDLSALARFQSPEQVARREARAVWRKANDWAGLSHYRNANAALAGAATQVVFIGDSITEMWAVAQPNLFNDGVVNRGVSGQTSPQILLRFMADVVALRPRVVHLMCGVNDVAGNTGPTTVEDYQNNMRAMLDLARVHGVTVILGGLTPVGDMPWAPQILNAREKVAELNAWLKDLAAGRGLIFVDYFRVLALEGRTMPPAFTRDGVHPGRAGYAAMRPLTDAALAEALQRSV